MKPAPFSYLRPTGLAEALAAYEENPEAKILAGGQSLVPLLSMRLATPPMLIDLNRVAELSYVRTGPEGVRVGAVARHSAVEVDPDVRRVQPLLSRALRLVAHPTIRNQGTLLGSIVHADPAAELPMVLRLLDGQVTVRSARGTRRIPAGELYTGPMESTLGAAEIATEASFGALAPGSGVAIDEVARRHGDYALCGAAAVVALDPTGEVTSVRTGYVSVSPTPLVLDLTGHFADATLSEANLQAAAAAARESVEPESDIHGTADYRRHLTGVLTRRVVARAHADASARTKEAAA